MNITKTTQATFGKYVDREGGSPAFRCAILLALQKIANSVVLIGGYDELCTESANLGHERFMPLESVDAVRERVMLAVAQASGG